MFSLVAGKPPTAKVVNMYSMSDDEDSSQSQSLLQKPKKRKSLANINAPKKFALDISNGINSKVFLLLFHHSMFSKNDVLGNIFDMKVTRNHF